MTDAQPPKATPARKTASKATTSADAPAAKKTTAAKPATPRTRSTKPMTEDAPAFAPVEQVAPAASAVEASAPAAAAAAPAGWYPVSAGSATQRYWDGTAWTEHIHDPAAAAAAATTTTHSTHEQLRAPDGTSPNTLWMWLTVGSMAVSIAYWIVTAVYWATLVNVNLDYEAATANQWADPLYLVSFGLGFLSTVLMILFPILDWVALRKRGVPKPFHWAWSLFALVLGSPAVYAIGRSVVVKRRTGKGLAPLWVYIGLQVVLWIVAIVAIAAIVAAAVSGFLSVFNDAGNVL